MITIFKKSIKDHINFVIIYKELSALFSKKVFFISFFSFVYFLLATLLKLFITPIFIKLFSILFFFLILYKTKKNFLNLFVFFTPLILFLILFLFKGNFLLTGGNNDTYNWALSSNEILGRSNFENILPHGKLFWEGLKHDGFGSYVFNALIPSLFSSNALFFSSVNIAIVFSFYHLVLFVLLCKLGVEKLSYLFSLFWITNPLFIYLGANYFFGQLLGTLFVFTATLAYAEASEISKKSWVKIVALIPSVFLIFVSYQSGFLPLIITLFIIISTLLDRKFSYSLNRKNFLKLLISKSPFIFHILCAFFVCLILSPDTAKHLIIQLRFAYSAFIGWSLPILDPFTLIGFPTNLLVETPISFYALLTFLVVLLNLVGKNKLNSINYLSLGLTYLFFLFTAYIIISLANSRPNNYQIWKAASFIILPFGFLFVSLLVNHFVKSSANFISFSRGFYILAIIISCSSFFTATSTYFNSYYDQYLNINSLRKEILSQNIDKRDIVLLTDDWRDTEISMNLLSKTSKLIPLNNTAIKPADLNFLTNEAYYFIVPHCNDKNRYLLINSISMIFYYEFGNNGCGLLKKALNFNGLYESESVGRWSNGGNVFFSLDLNLFRNYMPKQILFRVSPFLPNFIKYQDFDIYINNIFFKSLRLDKETDISLPIYHSTDILQIQFKIHHPISPVDFGSDDPRKIAILFKKISYAF